MWTPQLSPIQLKSTVSLRGLIVAFFVVVVAFYCISGVREAREDVERSIARSHLKYVAFVAMNYETVRSESVLRSDEDPSQSWLERLHRFYEHREFGREEEDVVITLDVPKWLRDAGEREAQTAKFTSLRLVEINPDTNEFLFRVCGEWMIAYLPSHRVPWTSPEQLSTEEFLAILESLPANHSVQFVTSEGKVGEICNGTIRLAMSRVGSIRSNSHVSWVSSQQRWDGSIE
ncbi:hypothetical protein AB1L42_22500 [Thalassoglobus sp. JC818]|uniref:hypothetical protein n=1 Tax=Thalassoglobus sp. JC818 TaxID=3232136 RepID=UPI003459DDBC